MKDLLIVFAGATLLLVGSFTEAERAVPTPQQIADESQRANEFFERVFSEALDRDPVFQTSLGIKKDYGKWDDPTDEFAQMELGITKENLQFLRDSINYDALNPETQLSYDLFVQRAENEIADFEFRYHEYPVNQMFGFPLKGAVILDQHAPSG